MLGMNDNGDVVVKKQFIITHKVVNIEYHTVDADSKAEAIRMVDEYESYEYTTDYDGHYHPKFDSILLTYQCSNIHNGWTDVASDLKPDDRGWHYNGMCKGVYQDKDAGMCHVCANAPSLGYRALTQDELQYLSDTHGVVIE